MRCYRSMARRQCDCLSRLDSLRHELFSLRRNQAIIGRDLVPTGLGLPRRRSRFLLEATWRCWLLSESPYQRLRFVEITTERLAKLLRSDSEKSILVLEDV